MNTHRVLAATAGLLALLAAITGNARRPSNGTVDVAALANEIQREADHITALELAQWIRERKPGLRVLDVRSDSEFAAFHIPNAQHLPLSRVSTLAPSDGETLVLYSEGGAHAAQAWVLLRSLGHRKVSFLRGGLLDWMDEVMNPVRPAAMSDTTWTRVSALSRYFGGVPRASSAQSSPKGASGNGQAPAASAVARTKRRGC